MKDASTLLLEFIRFAEATVPVIRDLACQFLECSDDHELLRLRDALREASRSSLPGDMARIDTWIDDKLKK